MKKFFTTTLIIAFSSSAFIFSAKADVDSARLTLAREVIVASQADKVIDSMTQSLSQAFGNAQTPEQKAIANKIMALAIEEGKSLMTKMDVVYAEVFTNEELKAMKEFYSSETGKSVMGKQSQVMQKMMPLIKDMQKELAPKIQKIMEEEAAKAKATKPESTTPTETEEKAA